MSHDYTNYTAGGPNCSYADLGAMNRGYSMGVPPQGKVSQGAYIIPSWDAISYDTLTSKVPSCNGYYSIQGAYGKGAGQCQTTYRTSLCGNQ